MDINNDQQYQQFRKDYDSLKGRGNLNESDQRRFNDIQGAISRWESSPSFHGDRTVSDSNTRTGGQSSSGGSGNART
jgi:hypothetical protein